MTESLKNIYNIFHFLSNLKKNYYTKKDKNIVLFKKISLYLKKFI